MSTPKNSDKEYSNDKKLFNFNCLEQKYIVVA